MLVSILHRITGTGLSLIGLALLAWWLVALGGSAGAYEEFAALLAGWPARIVLIGLSWAFFQHLLAGVRHLVMDIGAGFELTANRWWAVATILGSLLLTMLLWACLLGLLP